jgi:preprotein translocase subunit YajC
MDSLTEILIPMSFFASIVLIVYFVNMNRTKRSEHEHQERMLAIEKGNDIPIFPKRETKIRNPYAWPFAFIAIGLALVMGNIISGVFDLTWSFIPLFIGAGLLIAHFIYRKHSQQDKKSNSEIDDTTL